MNSITLYGIKNCDTIKKAKKWLDTNDIDYVFHDYRVDGIDEAWLKEVVEHLDWEVVLNKRGTTYRQLDDALKNNLSKEVAVEQMLLQPAMIKRPILIASDGSYHIGFKEQQYQKVFGK